MCVNECLMLTTHEDNCKAGECTCPAAKEAREVLNDLLPADCPTLFIESVNDAIGCVIVLGTEYERKRWPACARLLNSLNALREALIKGCAIVNGAK